jgi:hypothetical protein
MEPCVDQDNGKGLQKNLGLDGIQGNVKGTGYMQSREVSRIPYIDEGDFLFLL